MIKSLFVFCLVGLVFGCGGTEMKQSEKEPEKALAGAEEVVAVVGGKQIKMSTLDELVSPAINRAKRAYDQQLNEIRRQGLSNLIERTLLELEVEQRKLPDVQSLIDQEVIAKSPAPTAKAVAEFYAENKSEIGDVPIEAIKDRIVQYLSVQERESRSEDFLDELRAKYAVEERLARFRIDVGNDGPSKGPSDAKVTIVEYADFECPYCSQTAKTVLAIQQKYPKDVRVVFRHFPLSFHQAAMPAAIATRCAEYQGKFWEMHDEMFARSERLNPEEIRSAAESVGLDMAAFDKCVVNPSEEQAVEAEMEKGGTFGVEGTPAFFVNGIPLGGAQPFEAFEALVKAELKN